MTTVYIVTFSPQAWGCTVSSADNRRRREVFPTGVGVYRAMLPGLRRPFRFPHRRGGVPPDFHISADALYVFPTGVGVYRVSLAPMPILASFPHRRGGVP